MKQIFRLLFCFYICGLFGPQMVHAAGDLTIKKTLVVIGYSDENHVQSVKDLFSHRFDFSTALLTETKIIETLMLKDYTVDPQNPSRWVDATARHAVTILNSNIRCAGEGASALVRNVVCAEQIQHSEKLKSYLETNLNLYDQLIYIGHARLGMGLGLGPFYGDRLTFKPVFYNSHEAGKLRQVLIAGCDTEKYYARNFAINSGIRFTGTVGPKLWIDDLLPMVLQALNEN